MAKQKPSKPTSMRLSPESMSYIAGLEAATGWSASKVVEHLVQLAKHAHAEQAIPVKLIRHVIRTACDTHTRLTQAATIATAAKRDLRLAVAAVKERK